MKAYKNAAQDLKIQYGVRTYEQIEKMFDLEDGETPHLHFLLSLLGLKSDTKIDIDKKDLKSDDKREFSLRTMYQKNQTDFDTYFGLITILDNIDEDFNYVVNTVAFERTEMHDKKFLKMENVKTFYEYMLAGIDAFKHEFFSYGHNPVDVADSIHDFLTIDQEETEDLIEQFKLEELEE
ncbi:MAG: hypothetical protein ACOC2U_02220 [bacterium]